MHPQSLLRILFTIVKRMSAHFSKCDLMGSGTYGVVYSARSPSGRRSAIKYNLKSKDLDFVGCLRELNINHQLGSHPYIIPLTRITKGEPFDDGTRIRMESGITKDKIHFVYPLAECDLSTFLEKRSDITAPELRGYMMEILLGVEYMHGLGYIHRDLKPFNILVVTDSNGQYHMKVADFGLAKPYNRYGSQTPGTMSSWFRSPEIVMGSTTYDLTADLWSVGCIFYEMVSGITLVKTASNDDYRILYEVVAALPYQIPEETVRRMDKHGYYLKSIQWRNNPKTPESFLNLRSNTDAFDCCGGLPLFWDFLMGLLCFDPMRRYNATTALNHAWFHQCRHHINDVRAKFPAIERNYPVVDVVRSDNRSHSMDMVLTVWKQRHGYVWYSHRVLFHSVAIMDRVLSAGLSVIGESNNPGKTKIELIYLTILYTGIKYFSSLQDPVSFTDVAGEKYRSPECLYLVENYESKILSDVLKYDYYHPTIYDMICRSRVPDDMELYALLLCVTNGHHNGRNPRQAYDYWMRHQQYYISEATKVLASTI